MYAYVYNKTWLRENQFQHGWEGLHGGNKIHKVPIKSNLIDVGLNAKCFLFWGLSNSIKQFHPNSIEWFDFSHYSNVTSRWSNAENMIASKNVELFFFDFS